MKQGHLCVKVASPRWCHTSTSLTLSFAPSVPAGAGEQGQAGSQPPADRLGSCTLPEFTPSMLLLLRMTWMRQLLQKRVLQNLCQETQPEGRRERPDLSRGCHCSSAKFASSDHMQITEQYYSRVISGCSDLMRNNIGNLF